MRGRPKLIPNEQKQREANKDFQKYIVREQKVNEGFNEKLDLIKRFMNNSSEITLKKTTLPKQDMVRRSQRLAQIERKEYRTQLRNEKRDQFEALLNFNLDKLFICCCNHLKTIFFSIEEYRNHISLVHGSSFPNSTHITFGIGAVKIQKNPGLNRELLFQFKKNIINSKLAEFERNLKPSVQVPLYEYPDRAQRLFPLQFKPIRYKFLQKNLSICNLVYLQKITFVAQYRGRLIKSPQWYCIYCKTFFLNLESRRITEEALAEHMKKHHSNKIFKRGSLLDHQEEELELMEKEGKKFIMCACTGPVFPSVEKFIAHVMEEHQGVAPKYSSHILQNGVAIINPNFSQKYAVRSQLMIDIFLCGFCYEANKMKIYTNPEKFIHHLTLYHDPPYIHYLNSYHFNYEKWKQQTSQQAITSKNGKGVDEESEYCGSQEILDENEDDQSDWNIKKRQLHPSARADEEDQSDQKPEKQIYLAQCKSKGGSQVRFLKPQMSQSLALLQTLEQKCFENFHCKVCKKRFRTKADFFERHSQMPLFQQALHYKKTDYCFFKVRGKDKDEVIIIPSKLDYVSEVFKKKLIDYVCGCEMKKKTNVKLFIAHMIKTHERVVQLERQ